MKEVFATIEKAAKTDANILITGDSGTGKELEARAIHQASLRANKTFINKVNYFINYIKKNKTNSFVYKTLRMTSIELA